MFKIIYYYCFACFVLYLINHGCQLIKYKNAIANLKFVRGVQEDSPLSQAIDQKSPPLDGVFITLALSFIPIFNIAYLKFVLELCFLTTTSSRLVNYRKIFDNAAQK